MPKLRENINQLNSDIQAIKSAIVDSGVEIAEGTKIEEYADKVAEVYEAGKKAECDEFWDAYQTNGERTHYAYAFADYGWTDISFKPKYDIRPTGSFVNGFYMSRINDMEGVLEKQKVVLDTSQVQNFSYWISHSTITKLPEINITSATNLNNMFTTAQYLISIKKLIVNENTPFNSNMFQNCYALESIAIEGTIGQNGFNVQWSTKLSGESIVSIIEALSSATSGLTVTLSQTAVSNMTFPITSKQTNITYDSWATLIATKSNWTISLV